MAWYAVIDMSGKILRTGSCPESMIPAQAMEGEVAIETDGDILDTSHYFSASGFTRYPPKPGDWANFDHHKEEWFDPRAMQDIRAEAKAKVVEWASAALAPFTAGYPNEEVVAWGAKLAAARKVLAGGAEPLIAIEAQALGIPATALAAKVVEKGSLYEEIVALASAIRGKTHAAIDAAASANEVDAVLASAMDEATATLASLGVRNG